MWTPTSFGASVGSWDTKYPRRSQKCTRSNVRGVFSCLSKQLTDAELIRVLRRIRILPCASSRAFGRARARSPCALGLARAHRAHSAEPVRIGCTPRAPSAECARPRPSARAFGRRRAPRPHSFEPVRTRPLRARDSALPARTIVRIRSVRAPRGRVARIAAEARYLLKCARVRSSAHEARTSCGRVRACPTESCGLGRVRARARPRVCTRCAHDAPTMRARCAHDARARAAVEGALARPRRAQRPCARERPAPRAHDARTSAGRGRAN